MGQESLESISLDLPRNNNKESVGLCPKPPGQVPSDVLVNSAISQWKIVMEAPGGVPIDFLTKPL